MTLMAYVSRIGADPAYLQRLGQALYNFTYLEWVVIWTIVKLSANGFAGVPPKATAKQLANRLHDAIHGTSPPLASDLRRDLLRFHQSFHLALRVRNKLLHAHPFTAAGGAPRLGGGGVEWTDDEIDGAAKTFEDTAIEGNAIFHGALAAARP